MDMADLLKLSQAENRRLERENAQLQRELNFTTERYLELESNFMTLEKSYDIKYDECTELKKEKQVLAEALHRTKLRKVRVELESQINKTTLEYKEAQLEDLIADLVASRVEIIEANKEIDRLIKKIYSFAMSDNQSIPF